VTDSPSGAVRAPVSPIPAPVPLLSPAAAVLSYGGPRIDAGALDGQRDRGGLRAEAGLDHRAVRALDAGQDVGVQVGPVLAEPAQSRGLRGSRWPIYFVAIINKVSPLSLTAPDGILDGVERLGVVPADASSPILAFPGPHSLARPGWHPLGPLSAGSGVLRGEPNLHAGVTVVKAPTDTTRRGLHRSSW
jgi:hypothetical protein